GTVTGLITGSASIAGATGVSGESIAGSTDSLLTASLLPAPKVADGDVELTAAETRALCLVALCRLLPVRRRGLEYSSIPKLMRASPAPISAIARPGGMNHHQAPTKRACEFCAK